MRSTVRTLCLTRFHVTFLPFLLSFPSKAKLPGARPFWDKLGFADGDGVLTANGPPSVPTDSLPFGEEVPFIVRRGRPASLPPTIGLQGVQGRHTPSPATDKGPVAFARLLARACTPSLLAMPRQPTGKPTLPKDIRQENKAMRELLSLAGLESKPIAGRAKQAEAERQLQKIVDAKRVRVHLFLANGDPASLLRWARGVGQSW